MKSITEMILDDDIEFCPVDRKPVMGRILTPIHKRMIAWCDAHNRTINDFLDFAIERELDFQNGDLRYVIDYKNKKAVHPTKVDKMKEEF